MHIDPENRLEIMLNASSKEEYMYMYLTKQNTVNISILILIEIKSENSTFTVIISFDAAVETNLQKVNKI